MPAPLNIGIVIPGFSADEDDFAIPVYQNLVRELAREHTVRVVALRYPARRDPYPLHGAQVYPLGGADRRGPGRFRLWMAAVGCIESLHRAQPFDVLHAMWADETGLVTGLAGQRLARPVVMSVAGGELVGLRDIGYGSQLTRLGRWTVAQALARADHVLAASQYSRHLLARVYAGAVSVVPLGVDTTLFDRRDQPYDASRLVHVGSLMGVKDHGTLFRALTQLPNLTLDVIGTGWERAGIVGLAAHLGLAERVRFLGVVPHTALPAHYRGAALNVLPSRHEGQGMVTLEAAACGVPTVGTRVGLLPDVPELGIAVPVGDAHALAEAIRTALAARGQWSESAYHAAQRFSIRATAAQLVGIYRSVLR